MIDRLIYIAGMAAISGMAASILVVVGVVGVFLGMQGSLIRKERRLPQDSDARLFFRLFGVGAIVGLAGALLGDGEWEFAFPTGIASFVIGAVYGARFCARLNNEYLTRAYDCMDQKDFTAAIEDAKEVARSSKTLRQEANELILDATRQRSKIPLKLDVPGMEPVSHV